jgi:hypothetical protein
MVTQETSKWTSSSVPKMLSEVSSKTCMHKNLLQVHNLAYTRFDSSYMIGQVGERVYIMRFINHPVQSGHQLQNVFKFWKAGSLAFKEAFDWNECFWGTESLSLVGIQEALAVRFMNLWHRSDKHFEDDSFRRNTNEMWSWTTSHNPFSWFLFLSGNCPSFIQESHVIKTVSLCEHSWEG